MDGHLDGVGRRRRTLGIDRRRREVGSYRRAARRVTAHDTALRIPSDNYQAGP